MRGAAWALLAFGLVATPAGAFSNEYTSGPLQQAHGHGELVQRAAEGTPYAAHAGWLATAQRELDYPTVPPGPSMEPPRLGLRDWWQALLSGYEPDEQKKHFLRWYSGLPEWRAATRPLAADWADAVGYVRAELMTAYRAEGPAEWRALGHALHTIQDSYSPAHAMRDDAGRVMTMAYYPARDGHHLVDARDRLLTEAGELTPEARKALEASHELLVGFARWRTEDETAFGRWVEGYLARYLALAGHSE